MKDYKNYNIDEKLWKRHKKINGKILPAYELKELIFFKWPKYLKQSTDSIQSLLSGPRAGQPQNMPQWYVDYFELKLFKEQLRQEGHPILLYVFLKTGAKPPVWKIPSLYQEVERHFCYQTQGIQSQEAGINKSCYLFTNALPKPKLYLHFLLIRHPNLSFCVW